MFQNFFNSMYYGKAGKGDYTPENLPDNRLKLFVETLKVRWSSLIKLNLLYVLFLLPALIWSIINFLALEGIVTQYMAGEIENIVLSDQIYSIVWYWLLILWPCIAITGPATAGVSYVVRNWSRDQHSFLVSDFKDAMKDNWKQGLGISTITGFLPFLAFICWRVYGQLAASSSIVFVIPQMLAMLFVIVWALMLQIVYTMMVTYKLRFRDLIRNSIILSIAKLPISVGIRLFTALLLIIGIALLFIVPSSTIYIIFALGLYYILFGFAFSRFTSAALANALCENYMNARIEGAEIGIGLRQETEDDYEIDPTLPQPRKQDDE